MRLINYNYVWNETAAWITFINTVPPTDCANSTSAMALKQFGSHLIQLNPPARIVHVPNGNKNASCLKKPRIGSHKVRCGSRVRILILTELNELQLTYCALCICVRNDQYGILPIWITYLDFDFHIYVILSLFLYRLSDSWTNHFLTRYNASVYCACM